MPEYTVLADRHRTVKRNEQGRVTETKRYRKGDTLVAEETEVRHLLAVGGLVLTTDYEAPAVEAVEVQAVTPGALSGQTAEQGQPGVPLREEAGTQHAAENEEGTDYESWAYADLQRVAKQRTGDGSGAKADLVARLRKHDA